MTPQIENNNRTIIRKTRGIPASDGAGVKLTRIIASPELDMVDPFLLLDQFESDNPKDYIAGFPSHPHRGFETVTYMLAGRMRHKDSVGNEGVIEPGGVQWMTAGKGIIHSEMPEQEKGLMKGFQLWINLPAANKMTSPKYQEFKAEDIPEEHLPYGGIIRVISGETNNGMSGPVINKLTTPLYLDIAQNNGEVFTQSIPKSHNAFVYIIEGKLEIDSSTVNAGELGVLGSGTTFQASTQSNARYLLVAGKRLEEPVARGGPFVMNTRLEIQQAFDDFRAGRFV